MNKRIEKSINENSKLSDEFRVLAQACFGRIFDMLGEKNFERWINTRELSSRIKELVIESMSPEDEKKYPNWAGYYTRKTNTIRLRKNSTRDTATHEKFHFMTDNGESFPTFIDEGLTEYMKGMAENGANTYGHNVETVKFLHKMFGDSIIKAYLLGRPEVLNDKIALALVNENLAEKDNGLQDVKTFYENLNIFHNYVYTEHLYKEALRQSGNYSQEELDRMQKDAENAKISYAKVQENILPMFEKIVIARISQMAKKFEFYNNGKFDAEFAARTLDEMIESIPIECFENDFIKRATIKQEFKKDAAREIVKNSHLVVYDEGSKREDKIGLFVGKLIPNVVIEKTQVTKSPSRLKNDDQEFKDEESEMVQKLLYIATKDENLDVSVYLERIAKLQEKFNIPNSTIEYILTKHNSDRLSNSTALVAINKSIIKNFPLFRTLSKISDARQIDTIESTYRAIGLNRYLEIRDNQRFFIEIGNDGKIIEEELKYGHSVIFRGRDRLDISYKNGMDDFEVSNRNGKIKPQAPITLQELKELEFGKAITRDIFEMIRNREFYTILDDSPNPYAIEGIFYTNEVDTRSRKIDWNKFLETIEDYQNAIPESVRLKLIQQMTSELLDTTYGFGPKKLENGNFARSSEIEDIHTDALNYISTYLSEPNMKKTSLHKLTTLSDKLNILRRERVSKNAKTALLYFDTTEARDEYFRLQNEEKQKMIQETIQKFPYNDYIEKEDTDEMLPFTISGVYTTADIDTRNRTFLIDEFSNQLKKLLETIPESQRKTTFDSIFSRMVSTAYRIGEKQLKQDDQLQRDFDLVKNAISKAVFEGEELNKDELGDLLERFNVFHKGQAQNNMKHSAVAFKDDNTRKMYELVKSLIAKGSISSEDIQSHAKKIIEIHNEEVSKDEPSIKEKKDLEEK